MSLKMPEVGMRVRIKSLDIKGTINYIDKRNLLNDSLFPIQVELDKPYDESGHRLYRVHAKDIVFLKKKTEKEKPVKKKKAKKKVTFDEEVFSF